MKRIITMWISALLVAMCASYGCSSGFETAPLRPAGFTATLEF